MQSWEFGMEKPCQIVNCDKILTSNYYHASDVIIFTYESIKQTVISQKQKT
jgi:hypothetical protein